MAISDGSWENSANLDDPPANSPKAMEHVIEIEKRERKSQFPVIAKATITWLVTSRRYC